MFLTRILGGSARASLSADRHFIAISNLGVGFDIYSLRSGQRARRFGPCNMKRALPAIFVEGDRYLVCGSEDGVVHVWDVPSGLEVQTLKHHGELFLLLQ